MRGRVLSAIVNAGTPYTTRWTYNSADMPKTMIYPDGEVVTTNYNSRMLLDTLGSTGNSYVGSSTYDSAGRLTNRGLGNGLAQQFIYYGWNTQGGRLQTILAGALQDLNYTYDAAGNVTQIRDDIAVETSNYTYDSLNRLTGWTLNNGTPEANGYDPSTGNLNSKATVALTYNPASHPHAAAAYNGNTYGYDTNGNMVTRVIGSDTLNLGYDAENRLLTVAKNGSTVATFVYDGDGNRVQSTIGGTTTTFVGNYYEASGSTVTKYYYAGASRVAMNVNGTVSYLLSDQLGSTSVTTSSTGAEVSRVRYTAWGEIRYPGTTGANPGPSDYTYTGQYSNVDDFGLMFYNARWYDPPLGRMVQADSVVPGGVQGYDRYAYANNSPIIYSDPSGHIAIPLVILAAAGLVAIGAETVAYMESSPQGRELLQQAETHMGNTIQSGKDYLAEQASKVTNTAKMAEIVVTQMSKGYNKPAGPGPIETLGNPESGGHLPNPDFFYGLVKKYGRPVGIGIGIVMIVGIYCHAFEEQCGGRSEPREQSESSRQEPSRELRDRRLRLPE